VWYQVTRTDCIREKRIECIVQTGLVLGKIFRWNVKSKARCSHGILGPMH